MDPINNPFAPGAGSQPPELAGRETIVQEAEIALKRCKAGRHARSQMLLGLRGTGKTVLLNRIEMLAEENGHYTSFIEAPEEKSLVELLYPEMQQVLRKLSVAAEARAIVHSAMRALRSFAGTFSIKWDDISVSVEPEPGVADSGHLEQDLPTIFKAVGEAARSAGRAWTLLIDEVQYLQKDELAALIASIHRINQRNLPILFFGAGLPQLAALSGEAKSYAERLFSYPAIGPLDEAAAIRAIRQPVRNEGQEITETALSVMLAETRGYPYFLQEWGYHAWNIATGSTIERTDAVLATVQALQRLDEGFFQVRFDRLTPKERDYVLAMARLGNGPYRSSDIADELGLSPKSLGPRRSSIIQKGMIYMPEYGMLDFTVPMFDQYLRRQHS